jgi:hypothetical protein
MRPITPAELSAESRKRRVKSLHRWFATLQRNVNKPSIPVSVEGPVYRPTL